MFLSWRTSGSDKLCVLFVVLVKHISSFVQLLHFLMCRAVTWLLFDGQLYSVTLTAAQQEAESLQALWPLSAWKDAMKTRSASTLSLQKATFIKSGGDWLSNQRSFKSLMAILWKPRNVASRKFYPWAAANHYFYQLLSKCSRKVYIKTLHSRACFIKQQSKTQRY